ncbi:MAG: hypothetical protein AAF725_22465, partial [Acidobacteriota bacterium]
ENLPEAEELARLAVQSGPDSPRYVYTLACILAANGKWHDAFEQAEKFIVIGPEEFREEQWLEILLFFQTVVRAGKASEAADMLERIGMVGPWQPLREALETVALGRHSYLNRLAPEMRQPTEQILEDLDWDEPNGGLRTQRSQGALRRGS